MLIQDSMAIAQPAFPDMGLVRDLHATASGSAGTPKAARRVRSFDNTVK